MTTAVGTGNDVTYFYAGLQASFTCLSVFPVIHVDFFGNQKVNDDLILVL